MEVSILVEGKNKKFKDLCKAIEFLESLKVNDASTQLIKLLKNEKIRDWVKTHNNYLPLGYVTTSSYKGMTESHDYAGDFEHFNDCGFNMPDEDIEELNNIINKKYDNIIEDAFIDMCDTEADDFPCLRCIAAKFNDDFSGFELEEKYIERY